MCIEHEHSVKGRTGPGSSVLTIRLSEIKARAQSWRKDCVAVVRAVGGGCWVTRRNLRKWKPSRVNGEKPSWARASGR